MDVKKIKGKNRFRDLAICTLWFEGEEPEAIAGRFNITARQVNRIISNNRDVLEIDKAYEKSKRIVWLKRQMKRRGDTKKDPVEIQEQLRKEIEGDKPLVDNSVKITKITYGWREENNDSLHPPGLPERDSSFVG